MPNLSREVLEGVDSCVQLMYGRCAISKGPADGRQGTSVTDEVKSSAACKGVYHVELSRPRFPRFPPAD